MARQAKPPTDVVEIGKRLRWLRLALTEGGYTQKTMSAHIGSTTTGQVWENYENGRRRISIDHALNLCQRHGVTLDWIYRGRTDTLPQHVLARLNRIMEEEGEGRTRPRNGNNS